MPKRAKKCQNVPKGAENKPKMWQKVPTSAKNCQKVSESAKNVKKVPKGAKIANNGQKVPKRPESAKIGGFIVLVLLSAHIKRFSVSRKRNSDFLFLLFLSVISCLSLI